MEERYATETEATDLTMRLLKTIDRYIIRQFLGTFFFILALVMSVAVVFDISEKTEDFAKMSASLPEIITDYYFNFVVYYANLFSGLFIFLAVLIFTSRLAHRSEVIALLSSGVSFRRFMWPYFLAATFLTGMALWINHSVLPRANRTRLAFEEMHIFMPFQVRGQHFHREIAPGVIAYCQGYDVNSHTATRFSLEQWNDRKLESKLLSDRAVYDTTNGKWLVIDYTIRHFTDHGERIVKGAQMDTLIPFVPSDMGRRNEVVSTMTTPELDRFIASELQRGSDKVAFAEIERHQRSSYPFASYVFTLIGLSISSRKVRGGTGAHLALGVLLILLYIFAMKLTTVAATNAGLSPLVAVWIPNVLFGLVGLWIYRNAPK